MIISVLCVVCCAMWFVVCVVFCRFGVPCSMFGDCGSVFVVCCVCVFVVCFVCCLLSIAIRLMRLVCCVLLVGR